MRFAGARLPKGARLDSAAAARLIAAAGSGALAEPVRVAWPDPEDLHEDAAAERLARAAAGEGVGLCPPRQSRLDLVATCDGVLHVRVEALTRINAIAPLELFTLYHGQAVRAGQTVAAVKVAPHLVPAETVAAGEAIAHEVGSVIAVRAYRAIDVVAIAHERLGAGGLARFEAGARMKVEALGSRFVGVVPVDDGEPEDDERHVLTVLRELVLDRRIPLVLVGGVSAGDPISPFFAALDALGGRLLRRGVPAHPGSMIWLAELADSRLLGLPSCGMFSMATAADLILPRLLTGEALGPAALADLGHGGLLVKEMRFRFPDYARELEAPEG